MRAVLGILAAFLVLGMLSGTAAATSFHTNFSVVAGSVSATAGNTDAYANFNAMGSFTGDFWSNTQGNYLDTDVEVHSTTWASLGFSGWQNLAGYTNNRVMAHAWALGNTADMNLRFDNSMYVVQLERHDTSKDFLAASGSRYWTGFDFGIQDSDTSDYSAEVRIEVFDDPSGDGGSAFIDTNQWHPTAIGSYGWGNPDGLVSPGKPGYYTPVNTVSATGSGIYRQFGYGANSLYYNGMNMPGGGSATTTASFNNGFSFNPVVYAK